MPNPYTMMTDPVITQPSILHGDSSSWYIFLEILFYFIVWPRAHFMNNFSIVIQIQWKINFSVTSLYGTISLQIFAHVTTAQLSCHVQNFIAIILLQLGWQQNEISIEFEKSLVKWAPTTCIHFPKEWCLIKVVKTLSYHQHVALLWQAGL